ncbi:hypothetical protein SCA6_002070 [Theobroma cacao]
MIDGQ